VEKSAEFQEGPGVKFFEATNNLYDFTVVRAKDEQTGAVKTGVFSYEYNEKRKIEKELKIEKEVLDETVKWEDSKLRSMTKVLGTHTEESNYNHWRLEYPGGVGDLYTNDSPDQALIIKISYDMKGWRIYLGRYEEYINGMSSVINHEYRVEPNSTLLVRFDKGKNATDFNETEREVTTEYVPIPDEDDDEDLKSEEDESVLLAAVVTAAPAGPAAAGGAAVAEAAAVEEKKEEKEDVEEKKEEKEGGLFGGGGLFGRDDDDY